MDALRWLRANNPLYANIEINEAWIEQSITNNEELFTSLVSQSDVDSECQLPTFTSLVSQSDVDSECQLPTFESGADEQMECSGTSGDDSAFRVALCELETLARVNSFTIHDVPYDGNCMFSAVTYQLQSSGVCDIESHELRQMVVDHLYQDSVSQPVASNDIYNADTEPPTTDDAYINTITDIVADPELQVQLRWEKYLNRLRNGAWGDHTTLQGIANMLSVRINVLSTQYPTMLSIAPSSCNILHEIYVGLIMQYHYVGLDNVSMHDETSDPEASSDNDGIPFARENEHKQVP